MCLREPSHAINQYGSLCVCVCVTNMHFGQKWQPRLPSCVQVLVPFKMEEPPGWTVWSCALSNCYSITLSEPWPNRSHHVWARRTGFIPSRNPLTSTPCMLMLIPVATGGLQLPVIEHDLGQQSVLLVMFWRSVRTVRPRIVSMTGEFMLHCFLRKLNALSWAQSLSQDDSGGDSQV